MPKNYYLVLGIPADSTELEIKAAYRRLVKEYHPDRCSDRDTPFLGIQEAYSVLRDPVRRQEYDELLREAGNQPAPRRHVRASRRSVYPSPPERVEPLVPERRPGYGQASDELLRLHDIVSVFDRLFAGFSGSAYDGRQANPAVEIVLTPQQAMGGGVLRLPVPGHYQCPACGGSGERGFFFACSHCGGTGANNYDYPLRLEFPPGIPDNYVLRVPLHIFGRSDSWLTVRFRVR